MVTDVIVFIPRKAGKSTLTAVIALYELKWGEAGAEVYTLATTREQASIVFNAATGFVENMPHDVAQLFIVHRNQITVAGDSQTKFKALSRDTKKLIRERKWWEQEIESQERKRIMPILDNCSQA